MSICPSSPYLALSLDPNALKAIVDEQISMIKSAYDKKEFNLKSRSKSPTTLSKELNGEVFDYSNFLPKSVRNVNLGDQNRGEQQR
jgi:hypothetical protein